MKRLTEKLAGNGANVDNEQKMAEARKNLNAMVQNQSKANWVDQAFKKGTTFRKQLDAARRGDEHFVEIMYDFVTYARDAVEWQEKADIGAARDRRNVSSAPAAEAAAGNAKEDKVIACLWPGMNIYTTTHTTSYTYACTCTCIHGCIESSYE